MVGKKKVIIVFLINNLNLNLFHEEMCLPLIEIRTSIINVLQ